MTEKKFKISIIGLGYVGLPSALALYEAGHTIHGVDVSLDVIRSLKMRKPHLNDQTKIYDIPEGSEKWSLSSKYGKNIADSEIVIVTVPTPTSMENKPDISFVKSAFDEIMPWIEKDSGKILVLESTVYPGVTRSVISEAAERHGLIYGTDYHFAYCPERIDPGVKNRDIHNITRIIGCDDPKISEKLTHLYSDISQAAIHCGAPEVSEAAKLIENVQRDVDIALANEMGIVLSSMGLDSEEVFDAAATKWNFHRHTPGIGVGGHCIAVDPYYYLEIFDNQNALNNSLVTISRSNNNKMPAISSGLIIKDLELTQGDSVLLMGYSYKKNLGDRRNTPVKDLVTNLMDSGINCDIFDPICDPCLNNIKWHSDLSTVKKNYRAIIVSTPHDIFDLTPKALQVFVAEKKIFDGRRALNPVDFVDDGWTYSAVGY